MIRKIVISISVVFFLLLRCEPTVTFISFSKNTMISSEIDDVRSCSSMYLSFVPRKKKKKKVFLSLQRSNYIKSFQPNTLERKEDKSLGSLILNSTDHCSVSRLRKVLLGFRKANRSARQTTNGNLALLQRVIKTLITYVFE